MKLLFVLAVILMDINQIHLGMFLLYFHLLINLLFINITKYNQSAKNM